MELDLKDIYTFLCVYEWDHGDYIDSYEQTDIPLHADNQFFVCLPILTLSEKLFNENVFRSSKKRVEHAFSNANKIVEVLLNIDPISFRHFSTRIKLEKHPTLASRYEKEYHRNLINKVMNFTSHQEVKELFSVLDHNLCGTELQSAILFELIFEDTYRNVSFHRSELLGFIEDINSSNLKDNEKRILGLSSKNKEGTFCLTDQEIQIFTTLMSCFNSAEKFSILDVKKLQNAIKKFYPKRKQLQEALYDARRIARNHAVNNLLDIAKTCDSLPSKIVDGVKVIRSKGQEFGLFINANRHTYISHLGTLKPVKDVVLDFQKNNAHLLCTSYITNKNMIAFKNLKEHVCFGFNKFPAQQVASISAYDNYSEYCVGAKQISKYPEAFWTKEKLEDFSNSAKAYSEINILSLTTLDKETNTMTKPKRGVDDQIAKDYPYIKPDFVVCVGEPTTGHIELARELDIPVFSLDEQRYKYYSETAPRLQKFDKTF